MNKGREIPRKYHQVITVEETVIYTHEIIVDRELTDEEMITLSNAIAKAEHTSSFLNVVCEASKNTGIFVDGIRQNIGEDKEFEMIFTK